MTNIFVWSIAGSDSSGCAGIQADLKTFQGLGVNGCTVVTAVTSQSNRKLSDIQFVDIKPAIETMRDDFYPQAVKIGMLGKQSIIESVSDFLTTYSGKVILDPVMVTTSGGNLFSEEVNQYVNHLKKLFKYVDVLTPNLPEAEMLLNRRITSLQEMEHAAQDILALGVKSVLIKGGHFDQDIFSQDYWTNGKESFWLVSKRHEARNFSGTGCSLSSAIAASCALEYDVKDALVIAKMYVNQAMRLSIYPVIPESEVVACPGSVSIGQDTDNEVNGSRTLSAAKRAKSTLNAALNSGMTRGRGVLVYSPWIENELDLPYLSHQPLFKLPEAFPDCGPKIGLYPIVDSIDRLKILLPIGVKTIQLRIKNKSSVELDRYIQQAIQLAKQHDAHLFINDDWQLAVKHKAYGVHLGQNDLDNADIQIIHSAGLRLGISTHNYYETARAHALHPSYIAFGPIYHTTSKQMTVPPQGIEGLKRWRRMLNYPLVAIGGINQKTLPDVLATNVDGVALISAITDVVNNLLMPDEMTRYAQQIKISNIGVDGQKKLKNASVLCIGAGGLASPLLLYLAGAGVGTLGIVDDDSVELSNLQRQILYSVQDIGNKKALTAKAKLAQLNPNIKVNVYPHRLNSVNVKDWISQYDIVVDCSDNFSTRYLVNDTCININKPFVFASINEYAGQCATFIPQKGPCFRCLFPTQPARESVPDCNTAGVLGVLPGMLGLIQATEVLKYILNIGDLLIGRLLYFDALKMSFKEFKFSQDPDCRLCIHHLDEPVTSISANELRHKLKNNEKLTLLDVRTVKEHEEFHIGGVLIPLPELPQRLSELNPDDEIIVYCHLGQRSLHAMEILKKAAFKSVRSLEGGLKAWQNLSS